MQDLPFASIFDVKSKHDAGKHNAADRQARQR